MTENFVELEFLTETEKKKLEMVLNRNKKLNQKENARLKRLCSTDIIVQEANLLDNCLENNISTRSLNLNNENISDYMDDNSNKKVTLDILGNCSSCSRKFSILPWSCASSNNTCCTLCKLKMCKKCTHHLDRPNIEICKACHKNILYEAKSGKWFYNKKLDVPDSEENIRSSSVMSNDRWISVEKNSCIKKEFGSADNLESQHVTNMGSLPIKNPLQKRKFNNSAYFRFESTAMKSTSPEAVENSPSPFRRMNKSLHVNSKSKCLNINNCLDATLKSEDSGCALDMDEETASEKAIGISGTTFDSKCYFRPLQLLNQNNALNDPISNEFQNSLSFSQPNFNNIFNYNQTKYVGEIMLSFLYDNETSVLNVTVHKCKNLVNVDPHINAINPYVILFLRPNRRKQNKQKTRVQYKSNDPIYDEYFLINLREVEHSQSLIILLCHKNDKTGKDLAVGQIMMATREITICDQINQWFPLVRMNSTKISSPDHKSISSRHGDSMQSGRQSRTAIPSPLSDCMSSSSSNDLKSNAFVITGELSLALKFMSPSLKNCKKNIKGELHIWIKSAKILDFECLSEDQSQNSPKIKVENYQFNDMDGRTSRKASGNWFNDILGYNNNPVAKAHLFTNAGVISKEMPATKFLQKEGNYIWSSIMKFESDLSELFHTTLEISLWIYSNNSILNKILPSRCIGSVFLGRNSEMQKSTQKTITDNKLWHTMLVKHNIWIDETLVLKNRKDR